MISQFTTYGICVALGVLAAILVFWFQRLYQADAASLAICCIPAGIVGARLLYVIFRLPFFEMIGLERIFYLREGGYLLYGAVLGVCLAAVGYARLHKMDVLRLLDALTVPGIICIAICRMGEGSAGEGLGNWVEDDALAFFPLAAPNTFGEMQWAIFVFEALAALVMAVILIRWKHALPGQHFMRGLTLYAGCQIVFESLRMDSVLKIGFVRVSQVISAVILLAVVIICHLRQGKKQMAASGAIVILAGAGLVGGMEWALEKTQFSNLLIYILMILTVIVMIIRTIRAIDGRGFRKV